jgi:signal transduction histidine kinase
MPKWRWQRMSLRTVLISALIPVTLLPLIAFYFWSNFAALQHQIDDVSDRHLLIARNVGEALRRYHRDVISASIILTHNVLEGRQLKSGGALLENLSFRHLCIADARTGEMVAAIGPKNKPCPANVPAKRLKVINEIAKSTTPVFSGVRPGPGLAPTIFIVSRHGDRLAIGALTTDYFVELANAITFGQNGHAAIVDQYGQVLAHPLAAWRKTMKNISKVAPVARMLKGETGISRFYSPAVKSDMIAGFTAVKGTGWGVMIPQPFAELKENAESGNRSALLVLFAGFLITAAIGTFLAWRFTEPLSDVIVAAREMAEGINGSRIDYRGRKLVPAEFEELQDAFNGMAESVEHAKHLEESLRQQAEEANRTKTIFLASMSHELRTPLNAIIGFAEVILKDGFEKLGEEKSRDYLENILSGGQHLLDLINNILDLSRLELGEARLEKNEISLSRAIGRAVTMVKPIADNKNQELIVDAPDDIHLMADEMRVRQIIINLASNAVRFTQIGGRIELRTRQTEDNSIVIEVSDNGPGIDPADLDRVMQPFQRGEPELSRGVYGVGLGLGIVASLVEAHGALFALNSSLGKGTVATVTFPPENVS